MFALVLLLLLLITFSVRAQVVIELSDVLYTANLTVLCQAVIAEYAISLPSDTATSAEYCTDTSRVSPRVFSKNMEIVIMEGVTMSQDVVAFPTDLNTALTEVSFFPGGTGTIPLVSKKDNNRLLVFLVMGLQWPVLLIVGCLVYYGIAG